MGALQTFVGVSQFVSLACYVHVYKWNFRLSEGPKNMMSAPAFSWNAHACSSKPSLRSSQLQYFLTNKHTLLNRHVANRVGLLRVAVAFTHV